MRFPSHPISLSCIIVFGFLGVLFCELYVHILAPFFYQIVSLLLVDLWEFFPEGNVSLSYTMILCF